MAPSLTANIGGLLRRLFGRIETQDHRKRRVLNLVQSVVTSLGNKVVMLGVSFLSVPLTIGYLGPERYGAWVTIGSFLAWLQLTDFGLGNGLTNAVTNAAGEGRPDLVRMHLSNGLLLLGGIAFLTGLGTVAAWPLVDWSALLGVTDVSTRREIGPAVAAAIAIFLLQFPLVLAGKVYLAHQEGRIGNYWGAAASILSLMALLTVTNTQGGLIWLVIAVSGTSLAVNFASNVWTFFHHRPSLRPGIGHIRVAELRSLGKVGGKFFLVQTMALVTFQTDNIVISHYLGAARVPEYSLTYSLFSYTSLPQSILFSYLWTAYTEAIARKDIAWVKNTFRLTLGIGVVFTAAAVAVLVVVVKPFIGWWAGTAVVPSSSLIGWIAAWSLINAFTNPIACLLAAASHLRAQIVYAGIATALNIVLSIYLAQTWGIDGVIAATVIAYSLVVCVPVYIDAELLLKRLSNAV